MIHTKIYTNTEEGSNMSNAKYKELLDVGIITQEDNEAFEKILMFCRMFYETNAIEWDYSIAFGKLINI